MLMSWSAPETIDGQLILWQGEPGTGKSWALRALASEWASWCEFHYITDPDSFFVDDPSYMVNVLLSDSYDVIERDSGDVYQEQPELSKWRVLILEDTGELLSMNAKEKYGQGLSRLLNVVDGMIGQGLRVLALVTTNDELGTLHPAVTRPGRCASQIEFAPMTPEEVSAWTGGETSDALTIAELYARKSAGADAIPDSELEVEGDHASVTADASTTETVVVDDIAADARQELQTYWMEHPAERQEEIEDSGYDPVDEPLDYWPVELAEPVHAEIAARVNDSGILDLADVLEWESQEQAENDADEAAQSREFAALLHDASLPLPEVEPPAPAEGSVMAASAPDSSATHATALEALASMHRASTEAVTSLVASAPASRDAGTENELAMLAIDTLREFAVRPAPAAPQMGDIHVHTPQQDMTFRVESPTVEPHIDVHLPEQAAPNVTVNMPEQAAPDPSPIVVNVQPTPVKVTSPPVKVDVHMPEQRQAAKSIRVEVDHMGGKRYVIEGEDE